MRSPRPPFLRRPGAVPPARILCLPIPPVPHGRRLGTAPPKTASGRAGDGPDGLPVPDGCQAYPLAAYPGPSPSRAEGLPVPPDAHPEGPKPPKPRRSADLGTSRASPAAFVNWRCFTGRIGRSAPFPSRAPGAPGPGPEGRRPSPPCRDAGRGPRDLPVRPAPRPRQIPTSFRAASFGRSDLVSCGRSGSSDSISCAPPPACRRFSDLVSCRRSGTSDLISCAVPPRIVPDPAAGSLDGSDSISCREAEDPDSVSCRAPARPPSRAGAERTFRTDPSGGPQHMVVAFAPSGLDLVSGRTAVLLRRSRAPCPKTHMRLVHRMGASAPPEPLRRGEAGPGRGRAVHDSMSELAETLPARAHENESYPRSPRRPQGRAQRAGGRCKKRPRLDEIGRAHV